MATIVVTGRHRPHEVMFLALSALVGGVFVAGAKPPTSVEQLVAPWVLWTWYVLLLSSGLIGLASIAMADTYRALVLELAAMQGQTAAPLLYGVALLATGSAAVVLAAGFCLAWASASAWRGWQVWQGMRVLRQVGDAG
ncbi:hypothetical protein [Micromonospora carbonacea]|uniref:Uncharacterized protein n=1 Tax=Micromonospora carbonacea TaxID=47853 RepID=A0A1C5A2Y5_9ACTN|nr:hypothetical protein [Micromonospora carbonacea]SCF39587.1 hypothetical protein GA0070563_11140 [Micromonospora carbonacea]